jgi:Tol biopolymer transport system component
MIDLLLAIALVMNAVVAEPAIVGPGVVSTGHEFTLTFMPDGQEAYFSRAFPDQHLIHIMRTRFTAGAWQTPSEVAFSSPRWSDLDPAVSPDGKRLFFVSTRPKPGSDPTVKDMDIWYADRAGEGWGEPQHVERINSPAKEGSPTVAADGTLCFFSDRDAAPGTNAIYCASRVGDGYADPVKLPAEFNAGPSDTSPFLSPDGNVMLFYSTRPGGFGQADLYVSFRRSGSWSTARNLGPTVNTAASEYNPEVSRDGATFYFGRDGNIFAVPLEALGIAGLDRARFSRRQTTASS